MSGGGLGRRVVLPTVAEDDPLRVEAREAAGPLTGESREVVAAHLVDRDENDERRGPDRRPGDGQQSASERDTSSSGSHAGTMPYGAVPPVTGR
jgi:hypothetical protein